MGVGSLGGYWFNQRNCVLNMTQFSLGRPLQVISTSCGLELWSFIFFVLDPIVWLSVMSLQDLGARNGICFKSPLLFKIIAKVFCSRKLSKIRQLSFRHREKKWGGGGRWLNPNTKALRYVCCSFISIQNRVKGVKTHSNTYK